MKQFSPSALQLLPLTDPMGSSQSQGQVSGIGWLTLFQDWVGSHLPNSVQTLIPVCGQSQHSHSGNGHSQPAGGRDLEEQRAWGTGDILLVAPVLGTLLSRAFPSSLTSSQASPSHWAPQWGAGAALSLLLGHPGCQCFEPVEQKEESEAPRDGNREGQGEHCYLPAWA